MSDRDHHRGVESEELVELDDLRLVEALYGESPADDVDGDLLASYRDLRSMFSDFPEQEPPAAITAKLMSAAAESLKSSNPDNRGLWARLLAFFEPIGAHPALAAAASLVLVVTIGGVLVMTGRSELAEPETSPTSPPPARLETEAPAQAVEPVAPDELPAPPPTDLAPTEATIEPESKPLPKKAEERARPPVGKKRRGPETRSRTSVDKNRGKGKTGLDFSGGVLDSDDLGESAPDNEAGAGAEGQRADAPTMQPQKPTKTAAQVESLTSRGRRAAAKGDCAMVVSIGSQVRALDVDHFSTVYRRDTRINACYRSQQKKIPSTAK